MASRRFYSHLNRYKSKISVDIQNVHKEKFPEAVNFMTTYFIDDPFLRAMGVSARNRETQKFLAALWLTLLRSDLSLAAVFQNKICGLCINYPRKLGGNYAAEILQRLATKVKAEALRNLLNAWYKIDKEAPLPSHVLSAGRENRIFELAAISVASQFRQKGIGQRLIQSSSDMASLLGFDYIRADCTNEVTAKICDRQKWEKIWEIPFENFVGFPQDSLSRQANQKVKVFFQPLRPDARKL